MDSFKSSYDPNKLTAEEARALAKEDCDIAKYLQDVGIDIIDDSDNFDKSFNLIKNFLHRNDK